MTYGEALSLSSTLIGRIDSLSAEDKKNVEVLYRGVLWKEVKKCNCKDRHKDALIEVFYYLKKNKKMKEKSKYVLKPGAVLQVFGDPRTFTNDNLTDAIAVEYLNAHPNDRVLFAVIPDEYYESKKRKATAKETVD